MLSKKMFALGSFFLLVIVAAGLSLRSNLSTVIAQGVNGAGEAASTAVPSSTSLTGDGYPASDAQASPGLTASDPRLTAASLSYYFILGAQLQPRDSSTTFVYDGNGCMHITGGADFRLMYPVILPEGSVIKFLTIYYNDSSNSDMMMWLTQYNPGVGSADVTFVGSSGNAGYGAATSSELTHTYSAATSQYTLNYGWGTTDGSHQICGVQIAYYDPHALVNFLPVITR